MTDELSTTESLNGSCFCGSASYRVTGAPVLSAYCHCTICQRLTGCPFIHTLHYEEACFSWTHDTPHDEKLDFFVVPRRVWKKRARCKYCGVQIASYNSKTNQWAVLAGHLERDEDGVIKNKEVVKATAHIFYDTRMLDTNDELGKWDGYEGKSNKIA